MKNNQTPPVDGELCKMQFYVNCVLQWSDKIVADYDTDEDGDVIESSVVYKSGFIAKVLPNQEFVITDKDERITIAHTMKE